LLFKYLAEGFYTRLDPWFIFRTLGIELLRRDLFKVGNSTNIYETRRNEKGLDMRERVSLTFIREQVGEGV
jgi:hypothetical protein